jgi:hypothetical protein
MEQADWSFGAQFFETAEGVRWEMCNAGVPAEFIMLVICHLFWLKGKDFCNLLLQRIGVLFSF